MDVKQVQGSHAGSAASRGRRQKIFPEKFLRFLEQGL
jgi:hypothetical protein